MKTKISDNLNNFLWVRGESDVSIVSTQDFGARHIHNFWKFRGENAKAVLLGLDCTARKVVGIGFTELPKEMQTVHVYDGNDGVTAFEASEIMDEVKAWLSIEVSKNGKEFFLGGAQNENLVKGKGYVAALSFDEDADLLEFVEFDMLNCVTSLERKKGEDVLFCGGNGGVGIVEWKNGNFEKLAFVDLGKGNAVSDICSVGNAIYVVNEGKKGYEVLFGDMSRNENFASKKLNIPKIPIKSEISDKQKPTLLPKIDQNEAASFRLNPIPMMKASLVERPAELKDSIAATYKKRNKLPPKNGELFKEFTIKQIAIPGGKKNLKNSLVIFH